MSNYFELSEAIFFFFFLEVKQYTYFIVCLVKCPSDIYTSQVLSTTNPIVSRAFSFDTREYNIRFNIDLYIMFFRHFNEPLVRIDENVLNVRPVPFCSRNSTSSNFYSTCVNVREIIVPPKT